MQLDPLMVVRTMIAMALVFTGLATLVLWTGAYIPDTAGGSGSVR
jgi:hypothetical protein